MRVSIPDAPPLVDAGLTEPAPDSRPPGCEPSEEICNGRDDDCDGRVDEVPPVPCPGGGERYCVAGRMSQCPRRCDVCIPGQLTRLFSFVLQVLGEPGVHLSTAARSAPATSRTHRPSAGELPPTRSTHASSSSVASTTATVVSTSSTSIGTTTEASSWATAKRYCAPSEVYGSGRRRAGRAVRRTGARRRLCSPRRRRHRADRRRAGRADECRRLSRATRSTPSILGEQVLFGEAGSDPAAFSPSYNQDERLLTLYSTERAHAGSRIRDRVAGPSRSEHREQGSCQECAFFRGRRR